MLTASYRSIRAFVDTLPIVDTHDHLRPLRDLPAPMGVLELFRSSYLARAMRGPDGSLNGIPSRPPEFGPDGWKTVKNIVSKVRLSSYYQWLARGALALHQIEGPDTEESTWTRLGEQLGAKYLQPTWLTTSLNRAGVGYVIWDPFWRPGTWTSPDQRLLPSLRIDSSMVAFHPDASDYEGSNIIRDWASHFGIAIQRLDDVEELIAALVAANLSAGCRSLKLAFAYDRTLSIETPSRADALATFGKRPEDTAPAERLAFGDYVAHVFLEHAREHGLVVQVHTGMARLGGSNPLLLRPLLEQYPSLIFDLFHGGYPWVHEVAALAQNYPNVRLNLTWLPQLSTEVAVHALKEWLQAVPQLHRITWGADCWTSEEMYGGVLSVRHVVSRALAELMDDGYIDGETAEGGARSVLYEGAMQIYRLDTPTPDLAGRTSPLEREPTTGMNSISSSRKPP